MLTLKKIQEQINELVAEKTKNEKLTELNKILNKIKQYFENNASNDFFIEAIDLTENYIVTSNHTKDQK